MKTAILLISEKGLGIARQLVHEFPQTTLVSTTVQADDCQPIDSYDLFLKEHFHRFDAFLFIGAMGICVRSIAPYIQDKHADPAVSASTVPDATSSPCFRDTSVEPTSWHKT